MEEVDGLLNAEGGIRALLGVVLRLGTVETAAGVEGFPVEACERTDVEGVDR